MKNLKLSQNLDVLMNVFQIQEVKECDYLKNLLNVIPIPLKPSFQEIFDMLLEEIKDKGYQWNEEELKMKFIAFLFFIAEMEEKGKIQAFYERPLSLNKHGYKMVVKTDCMVATPLGKNTPREPHFFCKNSKKAREINLTPRLKWLPQ